MPERRNLPPTVKRAKRLSDEMKHSFGALRRCVSIAMLTAGLFIASAQVSAEQYEPIPFESLTRIDGLEPPHYIRWQTQIDFDVSFPNFEKLTATSARFDGLLLVWSTLYAQELAKTANLRIEADGDTSNLSVRIVDVLIPVRSPSASASARTIGVTILNSDHEAICNLELAWRGEQITSAVIQIKHMIPERFAEACVHELVWRSFGFPGSLGDSGELHVDELFPANFKVEFLKRLYGSG
jgi:hypothetical protein